MSSLLELEQTGVTLFSTFENYGSEVEIRCLYFCITRFSFPASEGSKWILDYKLSSDISESSYAYLSRLEDNTNNLIDLSGTFSVVTDDGAIHILALFLNHEFETNAVKEIKMPRLDLLLCEEELFPNGNLILRCHLWQNSAETKSYEYRVHYRSLIQKYNSPWVIRAEIGENNEKYFEKNIFNVALDFGTEKSNLILEYGLYFKKFLSDETDCFLYVKSLKKYYPDLYISHSIFVQCADGTLISLSQIKNYYHLVFSGARFSSNIPLEDFKNNGDFYYPNGILTLICHLKCVRVLEVEFESVNCENVTPVDVATESDVSNSRTIIIPFEEDRTLKHSMYSLYEEGKFCDVTLRSEMVTYPCHKAVLCSRSLVFSSMFESDMLEKRNGIVDITDVNPFILGLFLKYMYTDKIGKIDFENALLLFSVSDKYAVMPLRKKCISILKTKISIKNAVELMISADMHQNEELIKFSKNFICKHAKSIINSENWKNVKTNFPGLALEIQDQLIGKIFL